MKVPITISVEVETAQMRKEFIKKNINISRECERHILKLAKKYGITK